MQAVTFIFAFLAVLALIVAAAWLVRRFAGNRLGTTANRGRMPRLAVIDAAAVDGRRRLVLVRRDNVEHLLMIRCPRPPIGAVPTKTPSRRSLRCRHCRRCPSRHRGLRAPPLPMSCGGRRRW